MVYSTNPDFEFNADQEETQETIPPGEQKLYVRLDRKQRKGKTVTLVEGFTGSEEEVKSLGKELKTRCGVGGSAKGGEILLQGDFRERVIALLKEKGYQVKRVGG